MPLDFTTYTDTPDIAWERANPPTTETEMLRRLVPWLRLPELPGWKWDYSRAINHCGTGGCALGWAWGLWDRGVVNPLRSDKSDLVFYGTGDRFNVGRMQNITPAMVADYIEELLAEQPA